MFPIKKQSNLLQKIHFSVNLQYLEFYRVDTRKERLNAQQPSVLEWENVFLCGDIKFSERVITSNEEINVNSFGSYGWLIKRQPAQINVVIQYFCPSFGYILEI